MVFYDGSFSACCSSLPPQRVRSPRACSYCWIDGVNETAMLATGEAAQLMILGLLAAFG